MVTPGDCDSVFRWSEFPVGYVQFRSVFQCVVGLLEVMVTLENSTANCSKGQIVGE